MNEVIVDKKKDGYKVIVLDPKPDFIIVKNGKITAMKILTKVKGNRATKSFGHQTYCGYQENIKIRTIKQDFIDSGFDDYDFEFIVKDMRK